MSIPNQQQHNLHELTQHYNLIDPDISITNDINEHDTSYTTLISEFSSENIDSIVNNLTPKPIKSIHKLPHHQHRDPTSNDNDKQLISVLQQQLIGLQLSSQQSINALNTQITELQHKLTHHNDINQSNNTTQYILQQLQTNNLDIIESQYVQLTQLPHPTVLQQVQCLLYEHSNKHIQLIQSVETSNKKLNKQIIDLDDTVLTLQHTINQLNKQLHHNQSSYDSTLNNLELKYNDSLHELDTLNQLLITNKHKVDTYNTLQHQYDTLNTAHSTTVQQLTELRVQYDYSQTELKHINELYTNVQQQHQLLTSDKKHLEHKIESITLQLNQSIQSQNTTESYLMESNQQRDELQNKLNRLNNEHNRHVELTVTNELNKLNERMITDLQTHKTNSQSLYDLQINQLTQSRVDLLGELNLIKHELANCKLHNQHITDEYNQMKQSVHDVQGKYNTELKLLQYDKSAVDSLYHSTLQQLQSMTVEYEKLNEKNTILKEQYSILHSTHTNELLQHKHETKELRDKLSVYSQMELELDNVISSVHESTGIHGVDKLLNTLGDNVPTSNKRRIKQCILLSKQIFDLQEQIKRLTQQNQQLTDELDHNKQIHHDMQQSVDLLQQPSKYIYEQLQSKDSQITSLKKQYIQLTQQYDTVQSNYNKCNQFNEQLQMDMKKLLQNRTNIQTIQQMVQQIKSNKTKDIMNPSHQIQSTTAEHSNQPSAQPKSSNTVDKNNNKNNNNNNNTNNNNHNDLHPIVFRKVSMTVDPTKKRSDGSIAKRK